MRSLALGVAALGVLVVANSRTIAADDAAARSQKLAKASHDERWDGTLAVLLARTAVAASPTPDAVTALYDALEDQHEVALLRHGGGVNSVAFSADGAHVVTACEDGTAHVWSIAGAEEASIKVGRPLVRAWPCGATDRVVAAQRTKAVDKVDLILLPKDGAPVPLVADVAIGSICVSPAGEFVALKGADDQVSVFDRDGKSVKTLPAASVSMHPKGAALLVRTPDAKAVVVDGRGRTVELAFGKPVVSAAFTPSGAALVWGGDAHVIAYEIDGRRLVDLNPACAVEGVVADAKGGRYLVAGAAQYLLFDAAGRVLRRWPKSATFTAAALGESCVVFVDGSRHVSVWQDDQLAYDFDIGLAVRDVVTDASGFFALVHFADGRQLLYDSQWKPLTTDGDRPDMTRLDLYDPARQWVLSAQKSGWASLIHMYGREPMSLGGHTGPIQDAVFAPSGPLLATASKDGTARIWTMDPDGTEQIGCPGCWNASWSWTQDRLVVAGSNELRFADGHGRPVASVPTPERINWFICTDDRVGIVLDGANAALVYGFDGKLFAELPFPSPVGGFSSTDKSQRYAVFGMREKTVKLFDAKGKPAGAIDAGDFVQTAFFDADAKRVFVACTGGKARIYPATGGKTPSVEWTPPTPIAWGTFLPKTDFVLSMSRDAPSAQLWTTKGATKGKLAAEFKGPGAAVKDFGYTSVGDAVVLVFADHTARVFDTYGRETAKLVHADEITSARFLPDDKRLVTTCKDGSVGLWNRDGTPISTIHAHKKACRTAAFDVEGERILSVGEDLRARYWPATVEGLLAVAARRAFRDFTEAERRKYAELLH